MIRRILFLLGFRRENRRNRRPTVWLAVLSGTLSRPSGRTRYQIR
jgi:hypothetical protein